MPSGAHITVGTDIWSTSVVDERGAVETGSTAVDDDGPQRLGLLASALAGRTVAVASGDRGEPAWTDGITVFVDAGECPLRQLESVTVQASLLPQAAASSPMSCASSFGARRWPKGIWPSKATARWRQRGTAALSRSVADRTSDLATRARLLRPCRWPGAGEGKGRGSAARAFGVIRARSCWRCHGRAVQQVRSEGGDPRSDAKSARPARTRGCRHRGRIRCPGSVHQPCGGGGAARQSWLKKTDARVQPTAVAGDRRGPTPQRTDRKR